MMLSEKAKKKRVSRGKGRKSGHAEKKEEEDAEKEIFPRKVRTHEALR